MPRVSHLLVEQVEDAQRPAGDVDGPVPLGQPDLVEEPSCQGGKLLGLRQLPLAVRPGQPPGVGDCLIWAAADRRTGGPRGPHVHALMVRLPGFLGHR